MSASLSPGLNTPTAPPPIPPPPGTAPPAVPQANGLINSAPAPDGTSAPATPPNTAPAAAPGATPTTATPAAPTDPNAPNAFNVTPDQTVSHQIGNIIASGSPLMQQAEANARNLMNQRGLINSSTGITAGQSALYTAATPIAAADAATYAKAASDTTTAQNTAKLQAQQIAGQTNIAQIQTQSQKDIANIQSNTSLSVQDKISQTSQAIAKLQSDTSLTNQEKQDATTLAAQNIQTNAQLALGQLSANTQLTLQDKASSAAQILATLNNTSQQRIAQIQADTSLSVADKQTLSAQIIAQGNNATTLAAQNLVNQGALANIAANSTAQQKITQIQEDNKQVLQNSAGAQQLYTQALQNMQQFMTNPNLNTDQQATALNNTMDTLNEGLKMFGNIDANKNINSVLRFGQPSSDANSSTGPPSNSVISGSLARRVRPRPRRRVLRRSAPPAIRPTPTPAAVAVNDAHGPHLGGRRANDLPHARALRTLLGGLDDRGLRARRRTGRGHAGQRTRVSLRAVQSGQADHPDRCPPLPRAGPRGPRARHHAHAAPRHATAPVQSRGGLSANRRR